ncbi:hypothetical protein ASPWEDRAFT_186337 [Aspergillus wentii DTO 134E9]|uniref:SGNH hydrolase-type esterase domain-containing protein n=1 Tax=Aspergillus wentii DTO 134E9 TaxID=1073089 RepID=A0A1L9RB19_ASPWE|nr:uncharacterized protein ASPWEDRAFT_186337 [Aspergillus wentii DTO 134E9]KAI9934696.1 hypothetical protein MW887_000313 [Aspergillus wentii]OJJ32122.1 hypothetical protein ASPWEDRAFT_186337 [Aspergillus wentii DTO 134E9]
MLSMWRFLVYVCVSVTAVALPPSSTRQHAFNWNSTKYLIAFGDSYTYVQGTHGRQNFSFIGDQLDFAYDGQDLLSNMIFQNQTSTAEGGPNWIEFLTGCGVKDGLVSPLNCERQLWDFAFAGADISVAHTPLHHKYTISLVNQITQYKTYGHPILKNIVDPSQTLITVWIGINDINDSADYNVHFPTFYNTLMTTLFSSIQTLYSLGYRSFLFLNLPPLDKTPANQAASTITPSPNATQITWYNDALVTHAAAFHRNHTNTNVLVFDAHSVLGNIMDHPAEYGIVNTTSFCAGYDQPDINWNYESYGCPTPLSKYFWFNSGHLTSHVHEVLADALEATLKGWEG